MNTKANTVLINISVQFLIVFIIILSNVNPGYVSAQIQILATNPKQNSILADAAGGIEITFDRDLNTSTLSTTTIKVYGNYHGLYNLSYNFVSSSNILKILPSPAFIDGESITVVLTTSLSAIDGSTLARPFRLAFRTLNPLGDMPSAFDITDIPLLPGDQLPVKIALGDFNHDDFIDAAVINSTSNTITILINTTRRQRITTLTPTKSFTTGTTPIDITTADFDIDGNLDLAVANFTSNNISIHWGMGEGEFIFPPTKIDVGLRPSGIIIDDFNGDSRMDFAVSLFGDDKVIIYTNNGSRSFNLSGELNAEEGTFGLASADFDGDGDVDIAAINNGAQSISFFQNDNQGAWQSLTAQSILLKPIAMKWGNILNQSNNGPGDHFQELIVLSSDLTILGKATSSKADDKSQFTVFRYDSTNNSMIEAQSFSYNNRAQAFDLASMDGEKASGLFDRDHDLDLVLTDYIGGSIQYLTNEDNQGWSTSFSTLDTTSNPRTVVLADFDRDGDNDILYSSHLFNKLRLLWTPRGAPCPVYFVDFGDVFIGTTDSLDFPISIYGSIDVQVTIEVQDEQNFDASPRTLNLQNGQPYPLRLYFSPQDTLTYITKTVLITDYPLENLPCYILVKGRGVDVDFNITPSVLDFKTVPPGLSKPLYLDVTNNANGFLARVS